MKSINSCSLSEFGPRLAVLAGLDAFLLLLGATLKHRILLIEDDETFLDAVRLTLANDPIEIVWANTGAKGIQAFQHDLHGFSVVVIDYRLPDINGGDVCRHLKRLNSEQLFLFTSQHFEKEYLTDQLRAGSDGFVDKTSPPAAIRNEILRAVSLY